MAANDGNGKVVVNLATGMEDAERVTVALLVSTLPDEAKGEACAGCPPLERLFGQFAEGGGELLVCPVCFNARSLDESRLVATARIAGASPLHDWIGEGATVFSY